MTENNQIEKLASEADNYTAATKRMVKTALEKGNGQLLADIKIVMDYADLLIKTVIQNQTV